MKYKDIQFERFAKKNKEATRLQFYHTLERHTGSNPIFHWIHLDYLHLYLGLIYDDNVLPYSTLSFKGLWILFLEKNGIIPEMVKVYLYER